MPNGGSTIYAGRATNSIYTGRATPAIPAGAYAFPRGAVAGWPSQGLCAPPVQCCCKGPVNIAPGEIQSLVMQWATWLDSVPGYALNAVASASLWDMTTSPPQPANPDVIKVVSGGGADEEPDNSEVKSLVGLIPPYGTQVLIEASADAEIGAQYKLEICLVARDCDGRKIRQCDCVVIVIAEC